MHRRDTLTKAIVNVDLKKVRDNAERVVSHLPGIDVVAVTKATCGSPDVGAAMLAGGAVALGESRLENAERLRAAGVTAPIWLLRAPVPDLAGEAVHLAEISLESELETVVALDRAGGRQSRRHGVVAMVDLGDLREGMMPADLPAFVAAVEPLRHVDLVGVGVNLTCYGAIMPDEVDVAERLDGGDEGGQVGRHHALAQIAEVDHGDDTVPAALPAAGPVQGDDGLELALERDLGEMDGFAGESR